MAIEIVDFPIKNGGSFHSYVSFPTHKEFSSHSNASVEICGDPWRSVKTFWRRVLWPTHRAGRNAALWPVSHLLWWAHSQVENWMSLGLKKSGKPWKPSFPPSLFGFHMVSCSCSLEPILGQRGWAQKKKYWAVWWWNQLSSCQIIERGL